MIFRESNEWFVKLDNGSVLGSYGTYDLAHKSAQLLIALCRELKIVS